MPSSSRILLGVAALCAVAFVLIFAMVTPAGRPVDLDFAVASWIAPHRFEPLTTVLEIVTWLGSVLGIIPIAALLGVYLYRRRGFDPVRWLAITSVGASALYVTINQIFTRPRPPLGLRLHHELGWSFPSGHSTQAIAFSVMAAVLLGEGRPRRTQALLLGAGVLYALIVGFSRIYVCAHWTCDVLGGFMLGTAWLALVLVARHGLRSRAGTSPIE